MRSLPTFFMVLLLIVRGLLGEAMAMGLSPHSLAESALEVQVTPKQHAQTVFMAHPAHAATEHSLASPMTRAQQDRSLHNGADMAQHQPAFLPTAKHCDAQLQNPDVSPSPEHCGQPSGGSHHCNACGVCHSTLSQPGLNSLALCSLGQALGACASSDFASVLVGPLSKPPIS